ncbi:MAG: hypothetical protein WAW80_05030 [Candidatus Saccharimonadales bacterium]
MACGKGLSGPKGTCGQCTVPYQRAWCVGSRQDYLRRLIDDYKFTNARSAYLPLADLLHERLPELPVSTVIVPIPTISSHIRQRGYDHMTLIASRFARLRGLRVDATLNRVTTTVQRGAGARQRVKQAKVAFNSIRQLDPNAIYLLVDDVVTSGATVKYAAHTLIDAGASTVWVATISRQPVD